MDPRKTAFSTHKGPNPRESIRSIIHTGPSLLLMGPRLVVVAKGQEYGKIFNFLDFGGVHVECTRLKY